MTKTKLSPTEEYLLGEIKRHKYTFFDANHGYETCPEKVAAFGSLQAKLLIVPFVFIGDLAYRLTPKGFALVHDCEENQVSYDQFGYCQYGSWVN